MNAPLLRAAYRSTMRTARDSGAHIYAPSNKVIRTRLPRARYHYSYPRNANLRAVRSPRLRAGPSRYVDLLPLRCYDYFN